jgi:hypothetical protein
MHMQRDVETASVFRALIAFRSLSEVGTMTKLILGQDEAAVFSMTIFDFLNGFVP